MIHELSASAIDFSIDFDFSTRIGGPNFVGLVLG